MSELWLKLAFAGVVLGGVWLGLHEIEQHGYARAKTEWIASEAKITAAAEADKMKSLEIAREREAVLSAKLSDLETTSQLQKKSYEKALSRLTADVVDGKRRLSVAISGSSIRNTCPTGDPATPGESGDQARADLMPGTAAAILRIAGGAGQLVRDYNEVVARYNAVRDECNKP